MDSLQDLLAKKVSAIDSTNKKNDLDLLQSELDRMFGAGQARARQIKPDGTLMITASSAPLASNIKMQAHQLIQTFKNTTKDEVKWIQIRIGH